MYCLAVPAGRSAAAAAAVAVAVREEATVARQGSWAKEATSEPLGRRRQTVEGRLHVDDGPISMLVELTRPSGKPPLHPLSLHF